MKKVVRCVCMMAVAALVFASCNKENEPASVIKCSTEKLIEENEDEAKVYLQNNQVVFETGDVVALYNVDDVTPANSVCGMYTATTTGSSNVPFSSTSPLANDRMSAFYAFYPGDDVDYTQLDNGNRCGFPLNPVQIYRPNTVPQGALYMAAKDATTDHLTDAYFHFKNICGILSLNLYNANGKTIKGIRVTDKHFHLTGLVQLILPEIDPDELTGMFNNYNESNATYMDNLANYKTRIGYNVTNAGMSVTLNLGDGVALGKTKANATRFYMVLRPLALMKGCIIEVTQDGTTWTQIVNSNKDNRIRPSVIKNMSAINVNI